MFIQTETTPNPQTLKFLPGKTVLGEGKTAFFTNEEEAAASALAAALFEIAHVKAIFFGSDFITITKEESAEWSLMKPSLLTTIMEHYVTAKPIMETSAEKKEKKSDIADEDKEIVAQITELLDTRVRPAVAMDGGDILFHSYQDGIVYLEMHGACSGCPSSALTLKQGIENMLRHYIPEVQSVEPVL